MEEGECFFIGFAHFWPHFIRSSSCNNIKPVDYLSSFFKDLLWLLSCHVRKRLITHAFPKKLHGKALGIWMTMVGIGISVGPVVGGFIISILTWNWIFYFNIPFVILSFILVKIFVKESKKYFAK